jgi:hypothetical protein
MMVLIVLGALRFEFPSEHLADRIALPNVMRSAVRVDDASLGARMGKVVSRVENKRKTGLRVFVGDGFGVTDLAGRGAWVANTHAHRALGAESTGVWNNPVARTARSSWTQSVTGTAHQYGKTKSL